MMATQTEDKCALPRCTCAVPAGERYCSAECRHQHEHPDEQSEECPCEHPECSSAGPSGGITV